MRSVLPALAVATLAALLPSQLAMAGPPGRLIAEAYPPPPPDTLPQAPDPAPASAWGTPGSPVKRDPGPGSAAQAAHDGKTDGAALGNWALWALAGFALSIPGVVVAHVWPAPSEPDASRLVGKPPAYVAAYQQSYRRSVRSRRTYMAFAGCVTSGVVALSIVAQLGRAGGL